jgi:DNA (cytosine-5)-methyltransferase 1
LSQGVSPTQKTDEPPMHESFPVIDLFAGPGGLGEGFSAFQRDPGKKTFDCVAAIEKDHFAYQTLRLRHFLRALGPHRDDYHRYLKGEITREKLYSIHPVQFEAASASTAHVSLAPQNHDAVRKLINQRLARRQRWALVGGPPCQAYSLVGRSRMMGNPDFHQDERHFLYREYLKIIADHRPPVFIMENVTGLLSAKIHGKPAINRIVADLASPAKALKQGDESLSYNLYSLTEPEAARAEADPRLFVVRAEEYGVPQARHRMFILGIRSDVEAKPRQLRKHAGPTVRETIEELPTIRSRLSKLPDTFANWKSEISKLSNSDVFSHLNGAPYASRVRDEIRLNIAKAGTMPDRSYSNEYPSIAPSNHQVLNDVRIVGLPILTGHEARSHMGSDLRRYMFAAVFAAETGRSPKLADFPPELLPAHKNVDRGCAGEMFSDRFRVQLQDGPSTTVTSHISKDGHYFIHYDPAQCRSLTVREAARLQTFPDDYKFEGPRTEQYHQVGNAVPPYLARQIAEIVADVLDRVEDEA